jgi:hypothetical protein
MCAFPFLHASTRFSRETSNHPCREPRVGGEFRPFSWLFLGGAQVQDTSGMATMEGIKFHAIRFWTFKGTGTPGTETPDETLARSGLTDPSTLRCVANRIREVCWSPSRRAVKTMTNATWRACPTLEGAFPLNPSITSTDA